MTQKNTRYIFITGGVVSSLGKGILSAVLGSLLQARGYSVRLRKLDPYLNIDPGTMSPYQHGEVFVTEDGAETDLDLGHYERFTGVNTNSQDNVTAGRIYQQIINKERNGDYLGATIQIIPHVTNAIKDFIYDKENPTDKTDFMLCEIGGTIGDIEGLPFFEAIRQFNNEQARGTCLFIHMTLLPYVKSAHEVKTKPTQHSVKELRAIGIQPDILVLRTEHEVSEAEKNKTSLFCNVHKDNVIIAPDCDNIYEVPIIYHQMGLDKQVYNYFNIDNKAPDLGKWKNIVSTMKNPDGQVNISVVGKYAGLKDAYKSLTEALKHGGITNQVEVNIEYIDSEKLETEIAISETAEIDNYLDKVHHILGAPDGVLIPGGFGKRGIHGKMTAIRYAREKEVPFLGICMGMQLAVIEALHHVANLTDYWSTEYDANIDTDKAVIDVMTRWIKQDDIQQTVVKRQKDGKSNLGGTMRLGAYQARLDPTSKVFSIYKKQIISERHRHRYEIDKNCEKELIKCGLKFSGMSLDKQLPEIMEHIHHPWFIAVQYHPELKSRPFEPHPLFTSFIKAACKRSRLI